MFTAPGSCPTRRLRCGTSHCSSAASRFCPSDRRRGPVRGSPARLGQSPASTLGCGDRRGRDRPQRTDLIRVYASSVSPVNGWATRSASASMTLIVGSPRRRSAWASQWCRTTASSRARRAWCSKPSDSGHLNRTPGRALCKGSPEQEVRERHASPYALLLAQRASPRCTKTRAGRPAQPAFWATGDSSPVTVMGGVVGPHPYVLRPPSSCRGAAPRGAPPWTWRDRRLRGPPLPPPPLTPS